MKKTVKMLNLPIHRSTIKVSMAVGSLFGSQWTMLYCTDMEQ